jgi:hypothetical protein
MHARARVADVLRRLQAVKRQAESAWNVDEAQRPDD